MPPYPVKTHKGLSQIKASAGSGKTYTLTRHFLGLLSGANPDAASPVCALSLEYEQQYGLGGILAATFTNKAASEMKARVLRDLKLAALGLEKELPLGKEEAGRWIASILRRYDALNIRTIDSLLTLLARSSALTLGLPPDFSPVFSDEEYFPALYDELMDLATSVRSTGPGSAAHEVRSMLRVVCRGLLHHGRHKGFLAGKTLRDQVRECVALALQCRIEGRSEAFYRAGTQENLDRIAARLRDLHADLVRRATEMAALVERERLACHANFRKWVEGCISMPTWPVPVRASSFAAKASLDACLNKASQGKTTDILKKAYKDLCHAYARFLSLTPLLRSGLELSPLVRLAAPLAEKLERMQREEGQVPAMLIPGLARQALSGKHGVSDAFCRLGNRLLHLLIDEFQDTSREQWASIAPLAVECLAKGGSLTYVGDVKQAIYGWRGGDAALFDEIPREQRLTVMLEEGPSSHTLHYNWRSAPEIIAHNNRVFAPLAEEARAAAVLEAMLPKETPEHILAAGARRLAADFAGSAQNLPEKRPLPQKRPGLVSLRRVEAETGPALHEQLKEALLGLLREEILPRRRPGDIAVLVRRNAEAAMAAAWLAAEHIPVVTDHSFLLDAHPLIQRLVSFLAFLDYPPHDGAFWAFISGPELFLPAAGISEEELIDWLARTAGEKNRKKNRPLYLLFRRDFPEAWQRWIAPFHDQAGLMSAYDTVREIMRRFAPEERLPGQAPFLKRLLEVADAAERKGFSSLSAFLEFWEAGGKKEQVPMPEGMNAVRILTMHKAKGLEFPVVIVPFHHQFRQPGTALTLTEVDGIGLLARRGRGLGDTYYLEELRTALEQINLLYVTWTRPVEELHAFLTATPKALQDPGLARALRVLLKDMACDNERIVFGAAPSATPAKAATAGSKASDAPAAPEPHCPHAGTPATAAAITQTPDKGALETPEDREESEPAAIGKASPGEGTGRASEEDTFIPMGWLPRLKIYRNPVGEIAFNERRRGLLAHAALELLKPASPETALEAVDRAVYQALRDFPLPLPDPQAAAETIRSMLAWFISCPGVLDWLRNGRAEQSVMDEHGRLHRIDLLVDQGAKGFLTVEYKTGQPREAHVAQVRRYLRLVSQASGRPARGVLVYLDGRTLREIAVPEPCPTSVSAAVSPGESHSAPVRENA